MTDADGTRRLVWPAAMTLVLVATGALFLTIGDIPTPAWFAIGLTAAFVLFTIYAVRVEYTALRASGTRVLPAFFRALGRALTALLP